ARIRNKAWRVINLKSEK
ncbi:protein tolQ, partial [Vibrio parahaemolyticus V-223/04]